MTQTPTSAELLKSWRLGVEHFNAGRYWDAHEAWERGWVKLPPKEKLHVQSLIQGAAVFHLLEKGRISGAKSLTTSALAKLQLLRDRGGVDAIYPRIEIPGLEAVLKSIGDALSRGADLAIGITPDVKADAKVNSKTDGLKDTALKADVKTHAPKDSAPDFPQNPFQNVSDRSLYKSLKARLLLSPV
jgi:hypothetical protein